MPNLLIQRAHTLVTMDAARREIADGAILVRDRAIDWVGATADLPAARVESETQIVVEALILRDCQRVVEAFHDAGRFALVNGRMVVEDGHVLTVDVPRPIERYNEAARHLLVRAGYA